MSLKSRIISFSSIGFALGILLGVVITAVSATMEYADGTVYLCSKEFISYMGDPLLAFVVQALICGIYGMIAMGGSSAYYIEKWSLLKATVTHYIFTVASYYAVSFFLRWISPTDYKSCFIMFMMFLIPYVIIWVSKYLSYKAQINEINRELNVLKAAEDKGDSAA